VSDVAPGAAERGEPDHPATQEATEYREYRRPSRAGGGLRIYKPSQGYYTRVGTVIGAAVLILAGAVFLFNEIDNVVPNKTAYYQPLRYGIPTAFVVVMSAMIYWLVGLNRKANDFFIATEGEMKKVNWSTRKEVIRSTRVVIATVVLMAVLLFVVDILFMVFFRAIKVQMSGPTLLELLGLKS